MTDDDLHECPAPNCTARLPMEVLACRADWRRLPWELKTPITRSWNRGDIAGHVDARQAAVDWWEAHP